MKWVLGLDESGTLQSLLVGWQLCRQKARRIKVGLRSGIPSAALIDSLRELVRKTNHPPRDPKFLRDMVLPESVTRSDLLSQPVESRDATNLVQLL
jgi:hypothetical protein